MTRPAEDLLPVAGTSTGPLRSDIEHRGAATSLVRTLSATGRGCGLYWLVEEGGRDALRVRILELVDGRRVLPIFSFPEEAGLFAWRATRHRCGVRRTSPGEFTSLLGGVDLVALDPLSDAEGDLLDGSVSLARDEFLGSFGRGIPAANQRARR